MRNGQFYGLDRAEPVVMTPEDLVEVSPPYDPSGNTALTGANLLFEMLCVLPGVKRR